MPQWVALSKQGHATAHYAPREGYSFTAEKSVTPILLAELNKLLSHYVLGFIAEGEGYRPVALLGIGQKNLYLHPDGRWLGSYVPASLRGYPFAMATTEEQTSVLAIDEVALVEQGEPLFESEGQLAERVQKTLEFLNQCEQNRQVTQRAVAVLNDAGVIAPWSLKIERGEGQDPLMVNGLYRVDEAALNALEGEAYATLRGGPMALAHAQLFSMSQLSQLSERAKFHAEHGATQEVPENLDSVLDGMDDDDLSFDFDS
jgi:hypothetical protein